MKNRDLALDAILCTGCCIDSCFVLHTTARWVGHALKLPFIQFIGSRFATVVVRSLDTHCQQTMRAYSVDVNETTGLHGVENTRRVQSTRSVPLTATYPSIDSPKWSIGDYWPWASPPSLEETPVISGHHPAEVPSLVRSNSYAEITPARTASPTHIPDPSRPWLTLYNTSGVGQYHIHPHASKGSPYAVHRPADKTWWIWIRGTIQPISEAAENSFRVFNEARRSEPNTKMWLTLYDCSGEVEYRIYRLTPNSIALRTDDPRQVQWIHGATEPKHVFWNHQTQRVYSFPEEDE